MDCKDLTIGDFVKYDGKIKNVDAVYLYSVSVHDPSKEWSISEAKTYSIDDIEPIHLTSDILVKNGFENVRDNLVFSLKYLSSNVRIGITLDNESTVYLVDNETGTWPGFSQYDLFEIKYVHQLQHLLRLAGIDKEIEL